MAFSSYGSRFVASTSSPSSTSARVYTVPPVEVTSISAGGIAASEIDTTALDSLWKSCVLGTLDLGTLEVSGFVLKGQPIPLPVIKAQPSAMMLILGREVKNLTNDQRGYIRFDLWALLQGVQIEAAVDGAVALTLTYRLTDGISAYVRNAQDSAWVLAYEVGRTFSLVQPS